MPAPTDLNSQIALAKGWTWDEKPWFRTKPGAIPHYDRWLEEDLIEKEITHWRDPKGKPAMRPDFVGTLKGVSGMLWELGNWEWLPMTRERAWYLPCQDQITNNWICLPHQHVRPIFISSVDRPGVCVGDAWLSVFGKEVRLIP